MAIPKISNGSDIEVLRKALDINQAPMANLMGLSARQYFTLEQQPDSVNARHIMLAEHVAITSAIERGDASLMPPNVAEMVRKAAKLLKR